MKRELTMERPHTVLEKKLDELELRFTELFFPSTDNSQNPNDCSLNPTTRERISKEIQARVDFLKTLLLAEKECRSYGPDQLWEIEERLEGLEMAFRALTEGREILQKDDFNGESLKKDGSNSKTLQKDGSNSETFDEDVFNGESEEKDGFNGETEEKDGNNGEISQKDCFTREILEKDFKGESLQKDGSISEIVDKDAFNGESQEKDGCNGEISQNDCFTLEILEKDDFNGESLQKDGFSSDTINEGAFNGYSVEKDGFNGESSGCNCTLSCFDDEEDEKYDMSKMERFELQVEKYLKSLEVEKEQYLKSLGVHKDTPEMECFGLQEVKTDVKISEVQDADEWKVERKRVVQNRYCGRYLGFIGMMLMVLGAIWMKFGEFEDELFVLPPT